jgi:hypothetical protein
VRGLAVLSPTLYLPVVSDPRIATWYHRHSLVIVPAKKSPGTPIKTTASFGACVSSGSDDPLAFSSVIDNHRERVFSFVRSRLVKAEHEDEESADERSQSAKRRATSK